MIFKSNDGWDRAKRIGKGVSLTVRRELAGVLTMGQLRLRWDQEKLEEEPPKYAIEAYEFMCQALNFTQKKLGRKSNVSEGSETLPALQDHVSPAELLDGVRETALQQFGRMAYIVFQCWGIHTTSDIGRIVFRLIEANIWRSSPTDQPSDFDDGFLFQQAFVEEFRIADEDLL